MNKNRVMIDIANKLEKNVKIKNTSYTMNVFEYVLHMPSINQTIFDYL